MLSPDNDILCHVELFVNFHLLYFFLTFNEFYMVDTCIVGKEWVLDYEYMNVHSI